VSRKSVATIPVGGTLEFPAADGAGKVFVNVTSTPDIAVIDVKSRTVTGHYKLEGCRGASGLAYAPESKLLISSCGNGMAKVLDAATGKEVASLPIARGPDAVIYDGHAQARVHSVRRRRHFGDHLCRRSGSCENRPGAQDASRLAHGNARSAIGPPLSDGVTTRSKRRTRTWRPRHCPSAGYV
jgi:hypothetical protein